MKIKLTLTILTIFVLTACRPSDTKDSPPKKQLMCDSTFTIAVDSSGVEHTTVGVHCDSVSFTK